MTDTISARLDEHLRAPDLFGSASGRIVTLVFMVILLCVPLAAHFLGIRLQLVSLDFITRILCLAIAAVSLNLILGFGGMISFGHAAYIGIGAYCVGIPAYHGYELRRGCISRWQLSPAPCLPWSPAPFRCAPRVSISS